MGVGEGTQDKKKVTRPLPPKWSHCRSEAGGDPRQKVGCPVQAARRHGDWLQVTLRRERMYEFLDRLITIAMPRIRDFRGLNPKSFDGRGNYAMGLKEQIIFRKSATTRSTRFVAWTSLSPPQPTPTRKLANCCVSSVSRSYKKKPSRRPEASKI
jgi:hypothetical protein